MYIFTKTIKNIYIFFRLANSLRNLKHPIFYISVIKKMLVIVESAEYEFEENFNSVLRCLISGNNLFSIYILVLYCNYLFFIITYYVYSFYIKKYYFILNQFIYYTIYKLVIIGFF